MKDSAERSSSIDHGSIARTQFAFVRELRNRNRILCWTAGLQLLLFAGFLIGLAVDPRTVGGEPVWLKPAKFAGSIVVFTGTLAWLTPHFNLSDRFLRFVSLGVAAAAVIEITAIGGQATRGVESHFNFATLFDTAVYVTMGFVIIVMTLVVGWLFVRAARNDYDVHPAFALGITLGGGLFLVGSLEGLAMVALNANSVASGAGPTVPILGWSLVGDFRIAHFLGLHALQLLPMVGYLSAIGARRGRIDRPRGLVRRVGVLYALLLLAAFVLGSAPLMTGWL